MLTALISAIAGASGIIVDKISLTRERMELRVYLPLVFVLLCAFSLMLVPAFGRIDFGIALLPNSLFLLLLMVVVAVAWNVLFAQSLKREKVHQHEMITMTGPLITILLAAIFFPEEFDWRIFLLSIGASSAVILARDGKERFKIDREGYNLFLAVILMSIESILFRELLYSYTPVALYAVRTFFLAIFFMAYYNPRYRQVTAKHWWLLAASALLGVVSMVARLYAFNTLGVIHTTLITLISPVIIFFASWEILHERIRARVVLASLAVLIAVAWATVLAN